MFEIRRVTAFLCLAFAMFATSGSAEAGYAHFIYDVKSGKVLAAENAEELNYPASLTKMMTLYMTFEALRSGRLKWEDRIVMTPNATSKIPSKLGVPAGQTISVREAVMGMIVRSANDAAATMGDYLGGSEDKFGQMMTKRARALGMTRTVFRNASGLGDEEQVTTARDMAVLALALIRDFPREYELFSSKNMQFRGKRLRGHNNLMYRYPGMDGVKTGYLKVSGFNIASAVTIDGRRVIGVVLGGKTARQRDDRMAELLDQYVPGQNRPGQLVAAKKNAPADGKVVALEEQKRSGEGMVESSTPLAFATPGSRPVPRKEITLGAAPVARASVANLYSAPATPQQPMETWSIQIAAAGSRSAATATLNKAVPLLSSGFGQVSPSVEGYADSGKEYFRARLMGFTDRETATRACSMLQAKAMECFVVR